MNESKVKSVAELAEELKQAQQKTKSSDGSLLTIFASIAVVGLLVAGMFAHQSFLSLALALLAAWLVHNTSGIRAELRYNNELTKDLCKMNWEHAADGKRTADALAVRRAKASN